MYYSSSHSSSPPLLLCFFPFSVSSDKRVQQYSHCSSARVSRALARSNKHTSVSFEGASAEMKSAAGEGTPDGGMLNSDVVQEMKAEISETRSPIQQLTEMMQQLLQAKPVGGRQQGEVSGGSGRRAAHNESNGARRVPQQQETAADARRGATTAAVGGSDQWSDRNSMTSERSRPAADYMGRRPEVPAGVGPVTRMEHGEARDLYPQV